MDARYWVRIDNKRQGPFTLEEMKNRPGIGDETLVIPEAATGADEWRPLREVRAAQVQAESAAPSKTSEVGAPRTRWRAKKGLIAAAVALLVAAGASLSWLRGCISPRGVAGRYLAALQRRDYSQAYALLSETSKVYTPLEAFSSFQRQSGAKDWEAGPVVLAATASDHVEFDWPLRQDGKESSQALFLVNDRGSWRVAHVGTIENLAEAMERKMQDDDLISAIHHMSEIAPWQSRDVWLASAFVNRAVHMPVGVSREPAIREAVDVASAAAHAHPQDSKAHEIFAISLGNAGLRDEAEAEYTRALETSGNDKEWKAHLLVQRAKTRASKQPVAMLEDLKAAKKLDPDNVELKQIIGAFGTAFPQDQ